MKILKHIVMWKFKDVAEGCTKMENAQWMKEHLESLVGQIPELLTAEVGINIGIIIRESEAAYDAVLTATFRSLEDLDTYKNHPLHQEISNYCKKVRISRIVADYWVENR